MSGKQTREIVDLTLERDRYKAALERVQRLVDSYHDMVGATVSRGDMRDAQVREGEHLAKQTQLVLDQVALADKRGTPQSFVDAARGVKP